MERGRDVSICPAIPRHWLAPGRDITVRGMKSYFGALIFRVSCDANAARITADIRLGDSRLPRRLRIRLPHPQNRRPRKCRGGAYDAPAETVTVDPCRKTNRVELTY